MIRRRRRRRRKRRRVKEEESSQFFEVHKVDLGGEGVTSCSGAFDYFLRSFDCPFGHRSLARPFQHLVFVARCLFFELRLDPCPRFIIIVPTGFLLMVQICTILLFITTIITIIMYLWVSANIKQILHHLRISYVWIR